MITVQIDYDEALAYLNRCPGEDRFPIEREHAPFTLVYPENWLTARILDRSGRTILSWSLDGRRSNSQLEEFSVIVHDDFLPFHKS